MKQKIKKIKNFNYKMKIKIIVYLIIYRKNGRIR